MPTHFQSEPPADFQRPEVQAAFVTAVGRISQTLGYRVPILIDGAEVQNRPTAASVDPGDTWTVVCTSSMANADDVVAAIAIAETAAERWSARSWDQRRCVLAATAGQLRKQRAELAALIALEVGKPLREADAEVCEAIDFCEYYAEQADVLALGQPILSAAGERNSYRYTARGVTAVISPWSFPLSIPTGMIAAALVTGNSVVFKPAEQAPAVAYRLVQLFLTAGVPPEALALLPGYGEEVGDVLVTHPAVKTVAFTGSKQVGLSVLAKTSLLTPYHRDIKRVVVEMGGKNAIIVDGDVDLDTAVPAIIQSAFSYAGQKCSAVSRVVAVRDVIGPLIDRLGGAADSVPVGHPRDMATVTGPLIDEAALQKFQHYRSLAALEGDVIAEQTRVPTGGWYASPTIVVMPKEGRSIVAGVEVCGPLLCILEADDFAEAIDIANDTEYGLTAGVFSRSPAHIDEASRRLRAGNVYVNRGITGSCVGRQPFGGLGLSGTGPKAGGPDYLRAFVDARVLTENQGPAR